MAGRYLLIECDDEAQATSLRAQIDNASRKGKGFRVVGLFARPGPVFCRCGKWQTTRATTSTLKRGKKYGWMVCTECKKPAPSMGFLFNLIRPVDIINPPRYDIANQQLGFYTAGLSAVSLQNFEKDR